MPDSFTVFSANTIGYVFSAICFLALILFSIGGWKRRVSGRMLLIASIVSLLWSSSIVSQAAWGFPDFAFRYLIEVLRNAAWLLLLLRMLGIDSLHLRQTPSSTLSLLTYSCGFLISLQILLFFTDVNLLNAYKSKLVLGGHVMVAIAGLILIEHLLRNSRQERQYQIKFMCLGIGIIFSYDFFMYADALLLNKINSSLWNARGAINGLAIPFIIIASLRNKNAPVKFNLSRDFVFHSGMALFAGFYLLIMAGTGYFIRFAGGNWDSTLQIIFFSTSIIILLVLVFSGRVRANVRVLFSRHFFSYKYDYRDEWIRITKTLSGIDNEESLPHKAIKVLADIVGSNGGALWIKENNNNFKYLDSYNMANVSHQTEPLDSEFSQFLIKRQWIIDLNELKDDPELYAYLTLPEWLENISEAWLVAPLMLSNTVYGFAVINQPMVKISLNWEDHDLIKVAGRQVASELAQQSANEALTKAREFDAFNQMSAFIVHDIKTLVSQLSLMVKNAEKHRNNPAFIDDMILTTEHSVQKMTRLLGQLKNKETVEAREPINVSELLNSVVRERSHNKPVPVLSADLNELTILADKQQLNSVFNHLLQNAQDATPPEGSISITLSQLDNNAVIIIKDTGSGMSQAFIQNKLFQAFKSTKGVAGMGIGVYQCKEYICKIGGDISVQSELDNGTEFVIKLPLST